MGKFLCAASSQEDDSVNASDLWSDFSTNTTAHGIPHVTRAKGPVKKIWWSVLGVAFMGALGYHVYVITDLFFRYDVTVAISLEHKEELDFPAVTFCNMSPVRRSLWLTHQTASKPTTGVATGDRKRKRKRRSVPSYACPPGWGEYNSRCYYTSSVNETWADARAVCQEDLLADLVSIEDATESAKVVTLASGAPCWTGLYQDWAWADSAALSWTMWDTGQPDKLHPCVRIRRSHYNHEWGTVTCDHTTPWYICSIDMSGSCPDGWLDSGVRCYYVSSSAMVYDSAVFECDSLSTGATLATVDSETEYSFLFSQSLSNRPYWIGVSKDAGRWQWSDSTNVTFTKWETSPSRRQNCMYLTPGGQWLGQDCTSTLPYMCEKAMPCASTGTNCVEDCSALADGNYQSCERCDAFVTCTAGAFKLQACGDGTVWRDDTKVCDWLSSTCTECFTATTSFEPPTTTSAGTISERLQTTTSTATTAAPTTTTAATTTTTAAPTTTTGDPTTTAAPTTTTAAPTTTTTDPSPSTTPTITTAAPTTTTADPTPITAAPTTTMAAPTTTMAGPSTTTTPTNTTTAPTNNMTVHTTIAARAETTFKDVTAEVSTAAWKDSCSCCCGNQFMYNALSVSNETQDSVPAVAQAEPTYIADSVYEDRPALRANFQEGETIIEELATLDAAEKVKLGYTVEDMILDCQFEGSNCFLNEFSSFYNPLHGNCFTFNSGWENSTSTKKSRQTGRRHGLHLTLNIDQDDYTKQMGDTAGVRLVVHPGDRMPFPEDEGITISPGKATFLGLTKLVVARLPQPYGDCIDSLTPNADRNVYEEHFPVLYSVMACRKTCLQRQIIDSCGCADAYYPTRGQAFGNKVVPVCLSTDITQSDCKYGIILAYEKNELSCHCPNPCNTTVFEMGLSTGTWPADVQRDDILNKLAPQIPDLLNDANDPNKYSRNLMKLEIFYEEFNFEKVLEKPAYMPGNLASDLGGVIGLWFGLSLLTIFEFFELLLDILVLGCSRRCKRPEKDDAATSDRVPRGEPRSNRPSQPRSIRPGMTRSQRMKVQPSIQNASRVTIKRRLRRLNVKPANDQSATNGTMETKSERLNVKLNDDQSRTNVTIETRSHRQNVKPGDLGNTSSVTKKTRPQGMNVQPTKCFYTSNINMESVQWAPPPLYDNLGVSHKSSGNVSEKPASRPPSYHSTSSTPCLYDKVEW